MFKIVRFWRSTAFCCGENGAVFSKVITGVSGSSSLESRYSYHLLLLNSDPLSTRTVLIRLRANFSSSLNYSNVDYADLSTLGSMNTSDVFRHVAMKMNRSPFKPVTAKGPIRSILTFCHGFNFFLSFLESLYFLFILFLCYLFLRQVSHLLKSEKVDLPKWPIFWCWILSFTDLTVIGGRLRLLILDALRSSYSC